MTTTTTTRTDGGQEPDLDRLEEMTIAMAQYEIQSAMKATGLRKSDLAEQLGKPRSFISRILRGDHNLTIRTMARVFGACGFEMRFKRVPVMAAWIVTSAECIQNDIRPIHSGGAPIHATDVASVGASPEPYTMAI